MILFKVYAKKAHPEHVQIQSTSTRKRSRKQHSKEKLRSRKPPGFSSKFRTNPLQDLSEVVMSTFSPVRVYGIRIYQRRVSRTQQQREQIRMLPEFVQKDFLHLRNDRFSTRNPLETNKETHALQIDSQPVAANRVRRLAFELHAESVYLSDVGTSADVLCEGGVGRQVL